MPRNEAALIGLIREAFGEVAGEPGDDDCSLIPAPARGHVRVACTDQLIEGHHFRRDLAPSPTEALESAGWRAVVRNLSDLAACGARPVGFLWSLSLPDDEVEVLAAFATGAARAARRYGAPLLGGDLARGPVLACTVTAFGDAPGAPLSRSGAAPGEGIYLSREVGLSAEGLRVLLVEPRDAPATEAAAHPGVHAHLWPEPELELGLALHGVATACIDVSDGVGPDLARLCEASGIGAEIDLALPADTGEDYALLFTSPRTPPRGIRIGTTQAGGGVRGLPTAGFDHFG